MDFTSMKPFQSRLLVLSLVSLGIASLAHAAMPIEYLRPMKNSVSIGARVMSGASVSFGGPGLGRVDALRLDDSTGLVDQSTGASITWRQYYTNPEYGGGFIRYDDGIVYYTDSANADGNRPAQEVNADPYGRWQKFDSTGLLVGDFLAWDNSGVSTRNWAATHQGQVGADGSTVDMSFYGSEGLAKGERAHAKSKNSPGIELQFSRVIQRFKRFEWGFNATIGIAEFNAKNRQTLKASALKYTDQYQVLNHYEDNADEGLAFIVDRGTLSRDDNSGEWLISGPSFKDLPYPNPDFDPSQDEDPDTNPREKYFTNALETTASLGIGGEFLPTDTGETVVDGGVIHGYWQIKGVYYLARVGPMIRVPIGRQFSVSASAGYMGAWVGSKMRFQEKLIVGATSKFFEIPYYDAYGNRQSITDITQTNTRFVSGLYAEANFEWWVSTRTGFYLGALYEKLGKYKQQVLGREATVKISNGGGLRFGIMTRF